MSFTFTFTEQEMKVINDALMKAPFGEVAPVINSINKQIQEQVKNEHA